MGSDLEFCTLVVTAADARAKQVSVVQKI